MCVWFYISECMPAEKSRQVALYERNRSVKHNNQQNSIFASDALADTFSDHFDSHLHTKELERSKGVPESVVSQGAGQLWGAKPSFSIMFRKHAFKTRTF